MRVIFRRELFIDFFFVKKCICELFNFEVEIGVFDKAFFYLFMNVSVVVADENIELLSEVLDLTLKMDIFLCQFSIFDIAVGKIPFGSLEL